MAASPIFLTIHWDRVTPCHSAPVTVVGAKDLNGRTGRIVSFVEETQRLGLSAVLPTSGVGWAGSAWMWLWIHHHKPIYHIISWSLITLITGVDKPILWSLHVITCHYYDYAILVCGVEHPASYFVL